MNEHASDRINNRLVLNGIAPSDALDIARALDAFASKCGPWESVAVRVRSLAAFVGHAWSDDSNGDTIVAIVRGRQVQTVMFRRRSQPFTRDALNVERTVIL